MSQYRQNCRSCFGKTDVNISIFSYIKIQGKRLKVKDLLLHYTQLKILHKGLPTKICSQCMEHLKDAHIFSEKCLETDKLLRLTATQNGELSPPVLRPISAQKSKKKNIVSDNYLSTKSPREIKILPKQNASNAIMLNATSSDLPISNQVIVLQNPESKPMKNFGYELGLTRKGIYACNVCPRQFVSAKYLNSHTHSVHNNIQLTAKCHACDVELETKEDLLKHNMVMHFTTRNVDNRTKLRCKICSKRFRNALYLAKHMSKMHSGVLDESQANFDGVKNEFDETVQRSSGEDVNTSQFPIECKLCGKTFGFYKNYRIHKSIHEPNVCWRCNKCFPNKESMLAHLTSHTESSPFVCAYCHKVYMTRTALLAHYKTSYDIRDKVYFCGLCEAIAEVYLCHDNLLQHLKQHEESEQHVDEGETLENKQREIDTAEVYDDVNASTENDEFAATDSTDTVHYIVVNDGNCDLEKYVEITAEQVDMLISGKLTEHDLIQASKLLESNEQKSDTDQMDATQQDSGSTLETGVTKVADAKSDDIPDATVSETPETETFEIEVVETETEDVETLLSDTNVCETIVSETNVSETIVSETNDAKTDVAETQVSVSTSEEHKCSVCGDILTRKFSLWRHQAMAHKMYTMRCAYCPQKFNNMKLYDAHRLNCALMNGYPKGNSKNSQNSGLYGGVSCPICKEWFRRRAYMFKHLNEKHSGEARADIETRDYHCRICDKKLTSATGFGGHMKIHYGFPRHTCNVCGRRFRSATTLRNHVMCKHTGHRPHLCALCGRRFVNEDHLRKHVKLTHRKQRDFLCGVCGLTFQQSSHVTQHMWKHTGIKPHKCQYCQKQFTSKLGLKKHINRAHIDEYKAEQEKKEADYKQMEMAEQDRMTEFLVPDELIYQDLTI